MKSPYKKVIVYDLETGGFSSKFNSITEIAMVAIDLEDLQIVDTMSSMILPYIDLAHSESDPIKEAKAIIKATSIPDEETFVKTIQFAGEKTTLRSCDKVVEALTEFKKDMIPKYGILLDLEKQQQIRDEGYGDVIDLYFSYKYNHGALEATKISKELLLKEGVHYTETFKAVSKFIEKHTEGNSKPILAGHNILDFDNPFMEVLFGQNGADFYKSINKKIVDTLEEARIKWYELPNFQLGTCANEVGLTLKNAHRALPDTVANAEFYIELLKNLRGEGKGESRYVRKKLTFNF